VTHNRAAVMHFSGRAGRDRARLFDSTSCDSSRMTFTSARRPMISGNTRTPLEPFRELSRAFSRPLAALLAASCGRKRADPERSIANKRVASG
jgi:hypothetical protein